ncbi:carbohydrate porin [Belnapia sp. T18]|uniref:Carbohydrate porin n=2 Tax=Belnapia arida TaxID=2804533 RepID=A0ABS1U6T7_9PROT|nr:carbohydrate porin [Belnapia arida]
MLTEMDWSVSCGISLDGWRWQRPGDTIGLAANVGGLHGPQRRFLAAGGTGFILGDGRLNYAPGVVAETYYDAVLAPGLNAALDFQLIVNPGFNADRGPVPIATLRLRAAF